MNIALVICYVTYSSYSIVVSRAEEFDVQFYRDTTHTL